MQMKPCFAFPILLSVFAMTPNLSFERDSAKARSPVNSTLAPSESLERASRLSCQFFAQRIAFERPNLVAGVATGNLLANLNVEIFLACRRTLAGHIESVAQLQAAHRQRRAGENVVVLAGNNGVDLLWR